MKPRFQALILDLDGTTVATGEKSMPSERVIAAVQAAQKKVHVGVATGRPYMLALTVTNALGLSGLSVFNGGAEIIELPEGKVISRHLLSIAALRELYKLSKPFGYDLYTDANQYETPLTTLKQITKDSAKFFIEGVKTSDAIHLLEELAAVTSASAHPTTSWTLGDVVDIHVTNVNATKRHGVERLISSLGVAKERTMAIGDSHNDIPLLEAAGFKVAMGNAPDEVKAIADYITATQENDGVAEAIEKFIL